MKEAEDLRKQLEFERSTMSAIKEHNKALADVVGKFTQVVDEKKTDDVMRTYETEMSKLLDAKKSAKENLDFSLESQIDERIMDMKLTLRDMKKQASAPKAEPKKEVADEIPADERAIYDAWIAENEWFRNDPKMRKSAIDTEMQLRKDPDYKYATVDEILGEVKKSVEEKFSSKEKAGKPKAGFVEGAGLSAGNKPNTIKLTPQEVEIAKGLQISPEEYAKQKLFISRQRGEMKRI